MTYFISVPSVEGPMDTETAAVVPPAKAPAAGADPAEAAPVVTTEETPAVVAPPATE